MSALKVFQYSVCKALDVTKIISSKRLRERLNLLTAPFLIKLFRCSILSPPPLVAPAHAVPCALSGLLFIRSRSQDDFLATCIHFQDFAEIKSPRLRLVIYKLFSYSPNIPRGLSRRWTHRKCGLLLKYSMINSTTGKYCSLKWHNQSGTK